MKSYTIYIHDRRFLRPTRLAADLTHDRRAMEFADERLRASPHYLAVEVRNEDGSLCHFSSQVSPQLAYA